jgi:hypothetical protein
MRDWRAKQKDNRPEREAQERESLIRFLTSPQERQAVVLTLAAQQLGGFDECLLSVAKTQIAIA